jgi:hypothetical protein
MSIENCSTCIRNREGFCTIIYSLPYKIPSINLTDKWFNEETVNIHFCIEHKKYFLDDEE